MKFSKIVVFFLFLTVLVFTAVVFYFAWHGRYVPDILINRFFIAMIGEAGVLGAIKVAETIFEYRNKKAEMLQSSHDEQAEQKMVDIKDRMTPTGVQWDTSRGYAYSPEIDHFGENEGMGLDPEESPDDFEQVFPKGG